MFRRFSRAQRGWVAESNKVHKSSGSVGQTQRPAVQRAHEADGTSWVALLAALLLLLLLLLLGRAGAGLALRCVHDRIRRRSALGVEPLGAAIVGRGLVAQHAPGCNEEGAKGCGGGGLLRGAPFPLSGLAMPTRAEAQLTLNPKPKPQPTSAP